MPRLCDFVDKYVDKVSQQRGIEPAPAVYKTAVLPLNYAGTKRASTCNFDQS